MSRHPRARLFVAAELPPGVRAELVAWARSALAGPTRHAVRLLEAELMHVTLCFLGSRPVEEIDAIAGAVAGLDAEPCEVVLGAPVWLPPRRPRALAIELGDEQGALSGLQGAVVGEVQRSVDWQPERRRFRPHVTVARVRGGAVVDSRASLPPTPALHAPIATVSLLRSWLSPAGARYEELAKCALGP